MCLDKQGEGDSSGKDIRRLDVPVVQTHRLAAAAEQREHAESAENGGGGLGDYGTVNSEVVETSKIPVAVRGVRETHLKCDCGESLEGGGAQVEAGGTGC